MHPVGMTVLRVSCASLALLLAISACRWRAADAFQEELHCGMTTAEVEELARRFDVESFRPIEPPHIPNRYVTHVLNEGLTFFEFYFGESGLETVRQGASTAWLSTGTSYKPRMNLCTGEVTGALALAIKGVRELAGADILIDGEWAGNLSRGPSYEANIGLSSGPHQIRIEQEGYEPIVIPVDYGPYIREDQIVLPPPISKGSRNSP